MSAVRSPGFAVPGALLYLDARDNIRAHPHAWTNLRTLGGELSGAGNAPVLEEDTIEIPALGINTISKFYTHEKTGQCWGAQGDGLKLFLEDWTIELLLKMNSIDDSHLAGLRNQIAGFQPKKLEGDNAIRLFVAGVQVSLAVTSQGQETKCFGSRKACGPG